MLITNWSFVLMQMWDVFRAWHCPLSTLANSFEINEDTLSFWTDLGSPMCFLKINIFAYYNFKTCSNLICSAISLWIEETVKLTELRFDMEKIVTRYWSHLILKHILILFAVLSHFELKKLWHFIKVFRIIWKSLNDVLIWRKYWLDIGPRLILKHILIWFAVLSHFELKKLWNL